MSTSLLSRLKPNALSGVTTEVVDVTPEIADQMLKRNVRNRDLKKFKIDGFVRDMKTGRWLFDGSPIRFGVSGALLDGQNRLKAVIAADMTIPFLVIRGLPDAAQEVMDTGTKRTTADQLTIRGESYANLLAAIARRAAQWDKGSRTSNGAFRPTESEIRDYLDLNPSLRLAAEVASKCRKSLAPLPTSVIGLAYFLCARIDRLDANEFFIDQVTNTIGLQLGAPAHALRKKFETSDRRLDSELDLLSFLLKAWNLYRSGGTASTLRPPNGGWNAGNVPTPY